MVIDPQAEIQKNVRFNFIINQFEGSLFGLGLGFSSYVTVVPLFVASFTNSSVLIGLIAAMRMIGWQLPQLLTANRVARLRRYKPMSLLMTLNERIPFYVLALIALFSASLGNNLTLVLTFIFVTWQSMGGGLTGTAWQSLIAKLIPPGLRGTFYGTQSALANLLASGGAILSGAILLHFAAPQSFALCFLLAGLSVTIGFGFLAANREPETPAIHETPRTSSQFWAGLRDILRRDTNFRLFIVVRIVAQVAAIGLAFFTIYAVRKFNMDAGTAGLMAAVLLIGQVVASIVFGWLGDRTSHRLMFALGVLSIGTASAVAIFAPSLTWFYAVFALGGIANAAYWPTIYALTLEFGSEADRPYYIGLSNTLVAPATLLAPIIGGWVADSLGYSVMFAFAAVASVITSCLAVFVLREPRHLRENLYEAAPEILIPAAPHPEQP